MPGNSTARDRTTSLQDVWTTARPRPETSAVVTGTDGDDDIEGTTGADMLYGGGGNDYVDGMGGNDQLYGGTGHDTLFGRYAYGGDGDDVLSSLHGEISAVGRLTGGAGDDSYYIGPRQFVYWDFGVEISELADGGTDTVFSYGAEINLLLTGNVENIVLLGDFKCNAIGNALDNVITGNTAANYLDGGVGADRLIGGRGNDTYLIDNSGDRVIEQEGEGRDTVVASVTYRLGDTVENLGLDGGAAINGTGNDVANNMTGNVGANVIKGLSGNDTISGAGGADTLIGGRGDDTYTQNTTHVVSGANQWDTVTEKADGGIDTVIAASDVGRYTYQLDANVENLRTSGAAVFRLWGNALDNRLTGNAAANEFNGFEGHDTLVGGLGIDTFHFTGLSADSSDTISDFVPSSDRIQVSATAFGGGLVAGGTVWLFASPNPVVSPIVGTAGQFLYDTDSGDLSFDADGIGAGAAVLFATLTGLPALAAGDILIGA